MITENVNTYSSYNVGRITLWSMKLWLNSSKNKNASDKTVRIAAAYILVNRMDSNPTSVFYRFYILINNRTEFYER